MVDATTSLLGTRSVVGVMGGHAVGRDHPAYLDAALLGHALAERGQLVLTGGGPGAMEAANLGAACRSTNVVREAVRGLSAVPAFSPSIAEWAGLALGVKAALGLTDLPVGTAPEEAGAVAAEMQDLDREISDLRQGLGGMARVGSVTGPAVAYLVPAIRRLRAA